ncbi:MAG: alpha/beta hydrolase [Calditrichaeota bacterium]|nr:MAG: alpha/beta hydrolase [Calditrichota bacterium]
MKVLKMLLWIPVIIVALYLVIMLYIYFNQDKLVFYPTENFALTPDQLELEFETIELKISDSVIIHGWFISPKEKKSDKVILFCHGNAGNISHRLETAEYLSKLGVPIFLFDYRGYGHSTGSPTEEGVYEDAQTAYNWLVQSKQYKPEEIIIFGRSLGGAVGVELASRVKCGGLIVESSFTTVAEMGKKLFPIFPIKQLIRYKFDSFTKIKTLQCPILVTHSPDDDLIPYWMGEKLYEQAPEPKDFVKLSGPHNSREYFENEAYKIALVSLFESH